MAIKNENFNDDSIVTPSQLARYLETSRQKINTYKKDGYLKFNSDNKILIKDAKKQLSELPINNSHNRRNKNIQEIVNNNPVHKEKFDRAEEMLKPILTLTVDEFANKFEKLTYNETKTKLLQMQLLKEKVNFEKEINNLISAEEVKKQSFEIGKKIKDYFEVLINKLPVRLANTNDIYEISNLLKDEFDRVSMYIIDDKTKEEFENNYKDFVDIKDYKDNCDDDDYYDDGEEEIE